VRLRSTKRERKRGRGWELNGADSWLVWLSTPGRAGLPEGTPTLNPALWIFSPRRWLYPNGAEKRASDREKRRKRERKKEREREREREGELGGTKGSRKSGSWSEQGDVLCASYILYIRVPLWCPQRETAPYFSHLFVRRPKQRGCPRNSVRNNPKNLITK